MAIEIVDFPIQNGGSFHGKMLVHQRVSCNCGTCAITQVIVGRTWLESAGGAVERADGRDPAEWHQGADKSG